MFPSPSSHVFNIGIVLHCYFFSSFFLSWSRHTTWICCWPVTTNRKRDQSFTTWITLQRWLWSRTALMDMDPFSPLASWTGITSRVRFQPLPRFSFRSLLIKFGTSIPCRHERGGSRAPAEDVPCWSTEKVLDQPASLQRATGRQKWYSHAARYHDFWRFQLIKKGFRILISVICTYTFFSFDKLIMWSKCNGPIYLNRTQLNGCVSPQRNSLHFH